MINGKNLTFALLLTLIGAGALYAAEASAPECPVENAEIVFGEYNVKRFEEMFRTGKFDFKTFGCWSTEDGYSIIHYAAYTGDVNRVKLLVKKGADVNAVARDRSTALHIAVKRNNLEVVQWLIANGANVNAKDYGERSVLCYAACNGNLELVKYLADQGADVSFKYFGYGLLGSSRDLAKFSKSKECLDIMRFCVERGANLKDLNCNEEKNGFLDFCSKQGNLKAVVWLIEQNVNYDLDEVLLNAGYSGNFELVQWLVEQGANVNAKNDFDYTVLYVAAGSGNLEMVQWLVKQGADVNAKSNHGYTALYSAAKSGNLKLVKWLVEQGADINVKNDFNRSVLYEAVESGNLEMVQWLAEQGAEGINKPDILIPAVDSGNIELVKWLVAQGLDLSKADDVICAAARHASSRGNLEVIKWLVAQGLDVTRVDGILHLAIQSANLKLVQWLVDQKVDVNGVYEGVTVMAYIYFIHNRDIWNYLIDYAGVDVNASITNSDYFTALERAAKFDDFELVQYLVEHGASVNPRHGFSIVPFWFSLYMYGAAPEIVWYLFERDYVSITLCGFLSLIVILITSYIIYRNLRPKKLVEEE